MTAYIAALALWSAMHLLWQGALLAALFSWWQRAARPAPNARYRAAVSCLLALMAAFAANAVATHFALVANARLGGAGALTREIPGAAAFDSLPLLMALWAIGIGMHVLRFGVGAWHLARLRRRASSAPPELATRVGELAQTMAIETPRVLVSGSSIGPFVMNGVLMLPSGWEAGEELDALVLHELAHLRRGDVKQNTLLRAIQMVLWFHPAVWSLVRSAVNAREEACDVESVARSRSALVLARALLKLEERRQVLGATDGALATRVRRLISGTHGTSQARAFVMAPILMLAAGALSSAGLAPRSDRLAVVGAMAEALPVQRMVIDAHDPAGTFTLTLLNGRVASATIAGVPIERDAIRRRDRTVTLAGRMSMELDPRGAITWMPRCNAARAGGCDQ